MEIIQYLSNLQNVKSYKVKDYKLFHDGFYIKIIAELTNDYKLQITEYIDSNNRNYSYHLQDYNGELIIRFDNAPYHKKLPSYPHHIHLNNNQIIENFNTSFIEILNTIEEKLNQISMD